MLVKSIDVPLVDATAVLDCMPLYIAPVPVVKLLAVVKLPEAFIPAVPSNVIAMYIPIRKVCL
jgi:hypothetical protein